MHRSGTSALASALHNLGADLGPESSWLQPAADNPRGFFEYAPVVDLNRDVIAALGGTWSTPPPLPAGWVNDERLTELRDRAEQIASEIPERMIVKDPRLSLVQPLWEDVGRVPASVLCLRHPAAVAASITARNKFSADEGLYLWFRYSAAAVLNRPDALVVEYESLLAEPVPQLERVARHIDLEVSDTTVDAAAGTVYQTMSHHHGTDLPDTPIGIMCRRLYEALQSAQSLDTDTALWLWMRLATDLPWAGPADREIRRARNEVAELTAKIDRLIQENKRGQQRLQRLETDLRHTLRTIDIASISGTVDLLRTKEPPIR